MFLYGFLNPDIEAWLPARIEKLVSHISESYGVQSFMSYRKVCSVTVNDSCAIHFSKNIATQLLGEGNIDESYHSTMLGCGLANFFAEVPGAVIRLGNGSSANLLSPRYDFNDEALPVGASLLAAIVKAHEHGVCHCQERSSKKCAT